VIRNAEVIAARDSSTFNPGTVDVVVSPPIPVDDWTHDNLPDRIAEVRQLYLDTLKNWPHDAVPETKPTSGAKPKKAPAKKAAANKAPAKKAAAKKTAAKKTAAKTAAGGGNSQAAKKATPARAKGRR